MRYRGRNYYRQSKPTVRTITVKYAGNCACCGGLIQVGQMADYYPVGTIKGCDKPMIAHINGLDGNSKACYAEMKKKQVENSVDSFDMRYEDDCKDRCGL